MSATKIRADYESLQKIAQSFSTEASQIAATTKSVKTLVDTLRGGDWVGPGATAFYREMDASVFPSLNRLGAALGEAAEAANKINQLMNGAERDAAAVLRAVAAGEDRRKEGETAITADTLISSILQVAAGAVVGAIAGEKAGEMASGKLDVWMQVQAERAAEERARHAAIQSFIDAGDRQGAIDEAIRQYRLDTSAANGPVTYDSEVSGEGLTDKDRTVKIGDDAFSSPAWLASSVGHEIVHAEQARDGRWNDTRQGVAMNEVEAYDWELQRVDEFGLSTAERETLARRRETKYGRLTLFNKAFADAGIYTIL